MGLIGKLLRPLRAREDRSPLTGIDYAAPASIAVTSSAIADGGAIPRTHAGKGIGDNVSPPLQWTGVPADAEALVLIMDDVDVPMPKPLMHTIAVLPPTVSALAAGELGPGNPDVRFVKAFGNRYVGPAPIKGHGPHHYRFHVLALDAPVSHSVSNSKQLLRAIAGHVVARGMLTGTYER